MCKKVNTRNEFLYVYKRYLSNPSFRERICLLLRILFILSNVYVIYFIFVKNVVFLKTHNNYTSLIISKPQ